jgi:hypothetical protein
MSLAVSNFLKDSTLSVMPWPLPVRTSTPRNLRQAPGRAHTHTHTLLSVLLSVMWFSVLRAAVPGLRFLPRMAVERLLRSSEPMGAFRFSCTVKHRPHARTHARTRMHARMHARPGPPNLAVLGCTRGTIRKELEEAPHAPDLFLAHLKIPQR